MVDTGELFFPPIRMNLGKTVATTILYSNSKDVSSWFGPKAQQGLYIEKSALPRPVPKQIEIMVFRARPTSSAGLLLPLKKHSVHEDSVRYEDQSNPPIAGAVYLPSRMLGAEPPEECFLEITFLSQ